ncbi:MAG: PIN domain-containing protein [Candidatus Rokubacteria bacterium]|nr:PIN domain-containing protein [Candidatus Rokubacteria bacterium]MBI2555299.1 PIN domain-containing protein [Candidatus Rokubacteria bacterium]
MSRIFWDTNLFIYLIEDHGQLSERVAALRKRMLTRNDQLYTSALTLGEVLVKPTEAGSEHLKQKYEAALVAGSILIPFNVEAARIYATIRQDRNIRPPDAIQLACAAHARVDLFITNDDRLSGRTTPGIQFVTSLSKSFL